MDNLLDNVGQLGEESIRIGGRKIEDLPLAEGTHARPQLTVVRAVEKRNKIANIIARYPDQTVAYLKSRIVEAEKNIVRVTKVEANETKLVDDYKGHISLCNYRDKEIARITADQTLSLEEHTKQVKALYKQFPAYQIDAMETQIKQSQKSVERVKDVIDKEHHTIREFTEVMGLCMARDLELKAIGVTLSS
jgi:hypothetical protein